jgi:DNA-binding PadR family transcriptional regulator
VCTLHGDSQILGRREATDLAAEKGALLKLEQEGYIKSEWGTSDNNRRARLYRLTRAGRRQVEREERAWQDATDIVARFLTKAPR